MTSPNLPTIINHTTTVGYYNVPAAGQLTFSQGQTTQAFHIPDLRDVLGMSMYRVWYSLCSWVCVLSGVCWVCVIWSLSLDIC